MKTRQIMLHKPGGPSAMKWETVELPDPGPGEILVRHTAVGFNMVDTYHRSGAYATPPKPCTLGIEGAGVVEAAGRGVKTLKVGDRIAYAGGGQPGSYAEARVMKAAAVTKLPSWISDKQGAAIISKGKTVEYLFNRTHKLKKGDVILFHAAAGGVGLIAGQWAKAVGAIAIGVVSTEAKAKLAKRNGYKHVIISKIQDITKEVLRITKGKGVDVVYDSVGKDTWQSSLDSVRTLGLVVSFGSASGNPPPYDVAKDGLKNSAFIHRATTVNYMTSPEISAASLRKVFAMVKKGAVKIQVNHTYKLKDVVKVHRDAEARKTTGQVVMIP
ncbi:MAG: quinone oxidoreductase [Proteobacteria bacterium]|nr:quinone oxidoreductase [Pseudomonadota bacterium]